MQFSLCQWIYDPILDVAEFQRSNFEKKMEKVAENERNNTHDLQFHAGKRNPKWTLGSQQKRREEEGKRREESTEDRMRLWMAEAKRRGERREY